MILIPAMEDYFIAAQKKSEFIRQLIDEVIYILRNTEDIKNEIVKKGFNYTKIQANDIYFEYFFAACQRVLLKKQQ